MANGLRMGDGAAGEGGGVRSSSENSPLSAAFWTPEARARPVGVLCRCGMRRGGGSSACASVRQ